MQQKVGANCNTAKQYAEFRRQAESEEQDDQRPDTMLIKLARVAQGAVVRWKRTATAHRAAPTGNASGGGNVPPTEEEIRYTSRKLACTRCGHQQETSWMQLRTCEGYRAVHCRNCGKQERSARNKCQCDVVRHQCSKHRVDPAEHKSGKHRRKHRSKGAIGRRIKKIKVGQV